MTHAWSSETPFTIADASTVGSNSSGRPPSLGTRGVVAATFGNALEFYDFGVYAAYAAIIGHEFFPGGSELRTLLLSVTTFGLGFLSRPLGGFLLGAYADRRGRKAAMTLTFLLMAGSTTAIGLIPTYSQIGLSAPLLLIVARLIQGFSAGGELGASTVFLLEAAPRSRRGFTSSWQVASQGIAAVAVGLIGFTLARLMTAAALGDWGWRIPFLLGIAIAPVGIYMRNRLGETLDEKAANRSAGAVIRHLLSKHWNTLLVAILMFSGVTITQYLFLYMTTFALTSLHMPATTSMLASFVVGASTLCFAPLGGLIGDRVGAKATAFWPRVFLVLTIYPAMLFVVTQRTPFSLFATIAFLLLPQCIGAAILAQLIAESFPAALRVTGLAAALGVGSALFGGTAQIAFTWLIGMSGDPLSPLWYVTAMNVVSAAATLWSGIRADGG